MGACQRRNLIWCMRGVNCHTVHLASWNYFCSLLFYSFSVIFNCVSSYYFSNQLSASLWVCLLNILILVESLMCDKKGNNFPICRPQCLFKPINLFSFAHRGEDSTFFHPTLISEPVSKIKIYL